jgi:hypothetical protein
MSWVALVTWVVTAGLGFVMLTTWARQGGVRTGSGTDSHFAPPVVFGHFLLAAAGLVVWVVYLVDDSGVLAWVAFVDLVVVAVIGDTLVYRWLKDRRTATVDPGVRGSTTGRAATATVTGQALAEQRIPTAVVGAHGVFAVATVVLVLLAALGIGGS